MTHKTVVYKYGTGNPVEPNGSGDVRDGIDNLQSFDVFMNAEEDTYNQRDGHVVQTATGAVRSVGFKPGTGDFTTGFTVMPGQRDYAWYDPVSKNWYSWLGIIPPSGYVVSPGTNPVGVTDWKPVTDVIIRGIITVLYKSVSDMKSGTPVTAKSGDRCITGGTVWEVGSSGALALDSGLFARPLNDIHIRDFGAIPNNPTTTTVSAAIQAAFDVLPAYGTVQNGGAFQAQTKIVFEGSPADIWHLNTKVSASYKNNWKLDGASTIKAGTSLNPNDYMMEFIACNHCDLGELMVDGNLVQKRGIRVSGDGFTGTKRNSTNIKTNKVFFNNFAKMDAGDTFDAVVFDTLSPNNIAGDYSIDDSVFRDLNFLGCFGGAQRFASSEIVLDNIKYSFCSDSTVTLPSSEVLKIAGAGTSLKTNNLLFTTCGRIFSPPLGASVGRVSFNGMYIEESQAFWVQDAGSIYGLSVRDGYMSSGRGADFMKLSNNTEAQIYMDGNVWPGDPLTTAGYKKLDLGGERSSIHWVQQTGTSSFKSFRPDLTNFGCFQSPSAFIQPTQGNWKRQSYAAQNSRNDEMHIIIDSSLAANEVAKLRFKDINDAMLYIDQLGVTKCRIVLAPGVTHFATTRAITIAGLVRITGDGTNSVAVSAGNWRVTGSLEFTDLAVRGDDGAVLVDGGGKVRFVSCSTNMGAEANAFCSVLNGDVDIINPTVVVGKFVKVADTGASVGALEVSGAITVPAGKSVATTLSPCFNMTLWATANPATGIWPKGCQRKLPPASVAASTVYCTVNVDGAVEAGNWKILMSIGA